ncbi:MAG: hypothetical protein ACYCZ0_00610 [Minisyncoccota bacterium]
MTISIRYIALLFIVLASYGIAANIALAHGALASEEKTSGAYKVTFEASADIPAILAGRAVTYMFRLKDANDADVPYDYALVSFTTQDEIAIFSAQTDGPDGFIPGAMVDAAMPAAGDYSADVIFVKKLPGDDTKELASVSFDFAAQPDTESSGLPTADTPGPSRIPVYVWVVGALILGGLLGRFANRLL